ncbi:MAG TPA: sodium/solute symporter [Edaphobacter sp.]|nr:sodium/solute symporter [Edaphobacter sp.]
MQQRCRPVDLITRVLKLAPPILLHRYTLAFMLAVALPTHLHAFDLALIVVYLVGITLFGLRFRSGKDPNARSLRSYFLADQTIPWWAIALSIVSAETSTLTIISIPGVAFSGDFGFLQVVIGYMLGRIVVAALFLPRYFQGKMLTAYQLIDQRFGRTLHKVTAGLFLLTRAAAEGVRVFAVSIVVGIAIGTNDVLSIGIISALTLLYTFEGGMTAVIWTDVVQMTIYIGGTIVAISTLGNHVPGGWAQIHEVAAAAGKFHLFNFALNLTQTYTFWAGMIGGAFLTMASHGTDQLMVQRMLAARNLRESRLALLSSGGVILLQFTLFLLIGAGLYVFYGLHPATFRTNDYIFPTFIVSEMPVGIAGLLIAAILAAAMSNLSAAINSLSSTTVVDFYMHYRPQADDRERMMISRSSTVLWALVLFAVAVYSVHTGGKGHVVEVGLSIASVAYGALLGVFLLGTLTRYATQTGAILGMITGFALNVALWLQAGPIHLTNLPLLGDMTLPHVAWTWYVFIGAIVTFLVGTIASVLFPERSRRPKAVIAALILLFAALQMVVPVGAVAEVKVSHGSVETQALTEATPDFSAITTLLSQAIAAKKLPGAVVLVNHNGKKVFEQAYGSRALEPTVEPMTEETIFDMASLTKCLATATAVMQLYEAGKFQFDDPVAKYLPGFAVNDKGNVTIRELLTHYSGLPPDVDLKEAWTGKQTGIDLAFNSKLEATPGTAFKYSDINFITLGALVEKLSGESLDQYAAKHIFQPLGMTHTRFLPPTSWIPNIAPTAHNDDGPLADDKLLRGTVHDPTTRRMGGVAGHAGVFSTAADVSLYAQALLDKLLHDTGPFPLKQATLRLMTTPEQPSTAQPGAPVFTPDGKPTTGIATRGFGWDINTAFSRPRGEVFPIGSFGHTGFTGTTLWMDPGSDTIVILLSNAVHPRGNPPISALRGQVATAVARALNLKSSPEDGVTNSHPTASSSVNPSAPTLTGIDVLESSHFAALLEVSRRHNNRLRLGLMTNQTGLDSKGNRTIDILNRSSPEVELKTLFSPEHGILGVKDSTDVGNDTDSTTHLPVISLYGPKDSDKRPSHDALKDLDAVVIDLQDAGVRFYTYEAVVGYFLEAAAQEKNVGHELEVIVLDRPNPIGGVAVQGPVSDAGRDSYTNYMPLPIRHGFTLGELARYINGERRLPSPTSPNVQVPLNAKLTVIAMQNWERSQYFDGTHLPWTNPSPNLRNLTAATLYPGLGLLDATNVSVGRGTEKPFEQIGAPYIDSSALAAYLTKRKIAGVTFAPISFAVAENSNQYPSHGKTIPGISLTLTDRNALDAPELGIEVMSALHRLYGAQFNLAKADHLIASVNTMLALQNNEDPRAIAAAWRAELEAFRQRRQAYLLYR